MGSVFNADVQIPLAVPDPGTDWKLPPPGLLSYGAITTTGALAGVTGHDAMVLTGDRDRLMHGNENTAIDLNRTHAVTGNQKKTVVGNKAENVHGNMTQQTNGNVGRTNIGCTNDCYGDTHNQEHKSQQNVQEPEDFFHSIWSHRSHGYVYLQNYLSYFSFTGLYFNVVGTNIDFKLFQGGRTLAENDTTFFHLGMHGFQLKSKATEQHIAMMETTIHTVEASVGEAKFHEVAFTQKIVVVGLNQFT